MKTIQNGDKIAPIFNTGSYWSFIVHILSPDTLPPCITAGQNLCLSQVKKTVCPTVQPIA